MVFHPLPDPGDSATLPIVAATLDRRRLPRLTRVTVSSGPSTITVNHGATFLVAAQDGSVQSGDMQGLYSDDTRFLSRHELRVNGQLLHVLGASRLTFRHARWTLSSPDITAIDGRQLDCRVAVTLDRLVSARRMHEDIQVQLYGRDAADLQVSLALQTDFADVFEVRTRRWQRRTISTVWRAPDRLDTRYDREDFHRRCLLRMAQRNVRATYANGALHFPVDLAPGERWKVCLQYDLLTARHERPALVSCPIEHPVADRAQRLHARWHRTVARARPADPRMLEAFQQAVEDFGALRLYDHDFSPDVWLPAAGIPWFVAVFGRDSIIASLQALPVHPLFAIGTLQKLAQWQSDVDDASRDAEPGKICHEMRVGEWAHFRTVPHSPYYGTADATPLYLLLLAEAHRWLGDAAHLRRFRGTAERCLEWIDAHGDRDGDGFQEYAPRTLAGYRNQCWRDAADGVLDEDGNFPPPPIGTCEMQAYVYGAKRAVADLFEAWGDVDRAERLRREADELQRRFISAYWSDGDAELGFALDGDKRLVRTATSNPGHCLWMGILDRARGAAVVERLMRPDLFTGWGLRTLSDRHPGYDPHSYQRGSVWPHDTLMAAAGMRRYGHDAECWRLIDAMLTAVRSFERVEVPELFGGQTRVSPDVPVPYEMANVPQAWAAGAVFQAVRVLLGLEPDVPRGRVYVDPALPPWCPTLRLENIRIGDQRVTVEAGRRSDGSSHAVVTTQGSGLEVIHGRPPWLGPAGDQPAAPPPAADAASASDGASDGAPGGAGTGRPRSESRRS